MTFSMEVEPSVETEPETDCLPQPANSAATHASARMIVMIFFI